MTFLNDLHRFFNWISPVEIYRIDVPTEEFRAIEIAHDSESAKLADKSTQLHTQKYLLLEVVSAVKRVVLFSALADICINHQREFRLATEGDKESVTKIDNYLKEKGYTDSDLDNLTQKLLEDIGTQFPNLHDIYLQSKEILK